MSIYNKLSSIEHNKHYLNRYISFLEKCRLKNSGNSGYMERHHIYPKSLFPQYKNLKNHKWNLILLTPRQHFISHIMLANAFNGIEMSMALIYMSNGNWKGFVKYSKIYERLKVSLRGYMSNTKIVKDDDGNCLRVPISDKRYRGATYGRCVVQDSCGNMFMINSKDLKQSSFTSIHKNRVSVRDSEDNVFKISKDHPDYASGLYEAENKHNILVKDSYGNIFKVHKSDKRYLTGEFNGVAKDMVNVKDCDGKTYQVHKNNPSYIDGTLCGVAKGSIFITNGTTNKTINALEEIPFGWSQGVTKKSQKNSIRITNGVENTILYAGKDIPAGWRRGVTRKL